MDVMLTSGSRFPYSFVGQHPVLDNVVSKSDENLLHRPVQVAAMEYILGSGVDDLAIYVELKLIPCGIANAYRTRSLVTCKVENAFSRSRFPIDGVRNPQFRLGDPSGMQHPIHEVVGLFPIPQLQHSSDGQGGI